MMKKFGVNFSDFAESMEAGVSDFDAPTETMTTLITKVGVNFDSVTHNITDWVVE